MIKRKYAKAWLESSNIYLEKDECFNVTCNDHSTGLKSDIIKLVRMKVLMMEDLFTSTTEGGRSL